MILKTVVMLSAYFIPLVSINLGLVNTVFTLFILYLISGIGMAGIGMSVMHDAIHGSYSSNKKVNQRLGYTMNLVGANALVWKIQHNILHHTYTNINEVDDDINPPFFLRFSPHSPYHWLHRYQSIYVWLFYGLSTLSWVTAKDFVRITRYRRMGFFDSSGDFRKEVIKMIGWKLLYFSFVLIIPIMMVPFAWWWVLLAFISMHFLAGLLMSLVFQTAHIMPEVDFPLPADNGQIVNEWAIHQLTTTTNCSMGHWFSWYIGGLNYQIEHHLFPDVCHVHYKDLAPIVAATANEFGLQYHIKRNIFSALRAHTRMLNQLGQREVIN